MPGFNPAITDAAAGLLMISESDSPLEAFHLADPNQAASVSQKLLNHLDRPAGTAVEEQALAYFLRHHTRESPDYTAAKNETARRFQHLEAVLKQELKEVKVYRIGAIQVQAFILGWDSAGQLSGLKTTLTET
jgi:hypothetical protein